MAKRRSATVAAMASSIVRMAKTGKFRVERAHGRVQRGPSVEGGAVPRTTNVKMGLEAWRSGR